MIDAGTTTAQRPRFVPRCVAQVLSAGSWSAIGALVLGCGFAALLSVLLLTNYQVFRTSDRDVAIYGQVLWNTARGHPFETSVLRENTSHLAEHIAPVLLPLAVLSLFVPIQPAAMLLQQAALALAGAPVFLLARRELGGGPRAHAVLLSFYLAPVLSEIAFGFVNRSFHPVALSAAPIGFAAYLLLTGRTRPGVLLGLAAPLVEETCALAVIGLGLLLLVRRQMWPGLLLASAATIWLALATLVVMPAFHAPTTLPAEGNRTLAKFRGLRDGPDEAWELFSERGSAALDWWLLPNAGLAVLAPSTLIAAAPSAAVLLALDEGHEPWTHRAAPLLPLLWLAAVRGLARVQPLRVRDAMLTLLLALSALTYTRASTLPGGGRFVPQLVQETERSEVLRAAVASVPPDASVAASAEAAAHLAGRREVFFVGASRGEVVPPLQGPARFDWWILDGARPLVRREVFQRLDGPRYARPSYALWLLGDTVAIATDDPPHAPQATDVTFGDVLTLEGVGFERRRDLVVARMAWRVRHVPGRELVRRAQLVAADGRVLATQQGPALRGEYPSAQWAADLRIVEDVVFRPMEDQPLNMLRLRIGWLDVSLRRALPTQDASTSIDVSIGA